MAKTPTAVAGMIGVSRETAKKAGVLGYVTWFSVPDEAISLQSVKRHWMTNGLNPAPLPKDTKAINVFKRACASLHGRHRENGNIRENDVRLVMENREACIYQITTTVRDFEERVIDYQKAVRSIYFKADETVKHNVLGGVPRTEVFWLMDHVDQFIEKNSKKVEGAAVRKLIRNYLKDQPDDERNVWGLSGENLRGKAGGIYFVLAKHEDELDALAAFLDELYKGRAFLYLLPMAEGDYEREMLRRAHVANTRDEMMQAIKKAKGMLNADRERAVRSDSVAHQWAVYHQLRRKVGEYKDILGDNIDEIDEMASTLRSQLERLD